MIYFFDNELNMIKVATSKNVISAVHEHELNGLILGTVETDLSYTEAFINDVDYFGYYYKDNYYLHKIKRVEHEHENELVRITGRHIFFEDMLYGDYIRDVRPVNRDALYILNQTISANTRWQTVMTDTSKLHSETYYWVPPMEVLNDLTENVGIEYEPRILFDGQKINGFQLHVANRIGEDTPIRVPFGSRVINLKYEVDYSEIVTALYGHGKGEEVGDGYGRRINFSSVNFSRNGVVSPTGQLYMENPKVTAQYGKDDGSPKFGRIIFEDIESASELANATYEAYLEQSRPKMLFEASVVDLGDVGMGDGVLIIRREYDVYFNARIHKLTVDLLDAENADVELGDYAHFKESKVQRKTRENNNQYRRETSSRIQQLKEQFNDRFDGEVTQMWEDYEQALIDAHAEIQAAEQRMEALITTTRNDWTDTFNAEVAEIYRKADEDYSRIETEITGVIDSTRNEMEMEFNSMVNDTRTYAEQQAQERADRVRTDLETVTSGHQSMIDSLQDNVLDIDTFLGDKTITLKQQFDKVRTDFGTLQTDLDGVESDLTATKSDLQEQLDEARAELEGLEVGGRNLIPLSGFSGWGDGYESDGHRFKLTGPRGGVRLPNTNLEPNTKYVLSFKSQKISGEVTSLHGHQGGMMRNTKMYFDGEYINSFYENINYPDDVEEHFTEVYFNTPEIINDWIYIQPNRNHYGLDYVMDIWDVQITRGDRRVDWTPAPEDTEAKITTLNQEIEFIEGELSAKLEQTDIEPINNKITEYGNSLTANAQSIESLLDKTELLDGDITQWSNETKANAEEIGRTLTRISDIDGDIEQAQTNISANADGISGLLTRVTNTESSIADINLDVDGITADFAKYKKDIDSDVGALSTQVASYEANVDGFRAEVGTLQGDINDLESWRNDKGSLFEQAAEGFRQRVWTRDIDPLTQRLDGHEAHISDLQLTADKFGVTIGEVESSLLDQIRSVDTWHYNQLRETRVLDDEFWEANNGSLVTGENDDRYFRSNGTSNISTLRYKQPQFFEEGETYTLSFEVQSFAHRSMDYVWILNRDESIATGNYNIVARADEQTADVIYWGEDYRTYYITFTMDYDFFGIIQIGGNATNNPLGVREYRIKKPYLTQSDNRQWLYHPEDTTQNTEELVSRISSFEQTLESITQTVRDVEDDAVKQSQVYVGASGVQIGSTFLGDSQFASIFRVSPRTIDAVTEQMRVSGDLYVKGEIQSFAMEAVEGEFARLWADEFEAITITGDHIETNTITAQHLTGADAILNYLMARQIFSEEVTSLVGNFVDVNAGNIVTSGLSANVIEAKHIDTDTLEFSMFRGIDGLIDRLIVRRAFIDEMDALTLNAVYADLRSVNSEIMDTNILKADWIQGGNALLDKVFANTAMFERMMAKSGFVRTLNTVTIDTDQLTIRRTDGVAWVSNGMAQFDIPVQVQEYMDTSVEWTGQRYVTSARATQKCAILYTSHAGRYLRIGLTTGMRYDAQHASTHMGIVIRPENSPSGTNWQPMIEEKIVYKSSNDYKIYEIDLGKPTFAAASFSLEFYRIGDNISNPVTLRIHRAWITG